MISIFNTKTIAWRKPTPNGYYMPIKLQRLDDQFCAYCVQYCGGGKYFKTLEEVKQYLYGRWGITLTGTEGV